MSPFTYPTFAAIALLTSLGFASAQPAHEHEAHHPENSAPAPAAGLSAPSGGMDMGKMMGSNTEQMTPMMRMMRGMGAGGEMRMMPSDTSKAESLSSRPRSASPKRSFRNGTRSPRRYATARNRCGRPWAICRPGCRQRCRRNWTP
jgi:hypothetical protein